MRLGLRPLLEHSLHPRLRRREPEGGEEGGEGMLRHRALRLLATDAGEEGCVCDLGAVSVDTLSVSDVVLPLGEPRTRDLERRAVELHHHRAGRHGRNCNGPDPFAEPLDARAVKGRPARPKGRPFGPPGGPSGRQAGQGRARGRPTGPPSRPDHSVKCAGSSKTGSGDLFLLNFFGVCVKDALFLPPRGPLPPPQAHLRPRPVKATSPLTGHRFLHGVTSQPLTRSQVRDPKGQPHEARKIGELVRRLGQGRKTRSRWYGRCWEGKINLETFFPALF